jgi:hypothetical protein
MDPITSASAYVALLTYLRDPAIGLAVIGPGVLSLAIVGFYARAGRISPRLQLLWVLAVVISFWCARWESSAEAESLYIYSGFSVACMLLLFHRVYISPALAYALTFLSLWWVDVTRAFCQALRCNWPLDQFYVGVGGAGHTDALVWVPLLTAGFVGYALVRLKAQGARLREI